MVRLDLDRIRQARAVIDPVFLDSPQYDCAPLGDVLGCSITLKIETLNPVRSFKGRGTETVLSPARAARGVAHRDLCERRQPGPGPGLQRSAARDPGDRRRGPGPRTRSRSNASGRSGRPSGCHGDDIEDARLLARTIAEERGVHLVEDSLDVATCEGAGDDRPRAAATAAAAGHVLIALGGGALASGVGHVAKALAPHVEVVAVQPTGAPAMALSWRRGTVVHTDTMDTIADGVAGRHPIPEVLDDLLVVVDDVVLVGEDSIKAGMRLLHRHAGVVVEPSAALGVAAVLENRDRFAGRRVATVICGSNVTSDDFERWVFGTGR